MASRKTLRDEDLRLNIILDGKQVPAENKKLMSELGKLERETTKLNIANIKLKNEIKALDKTSGDYEVKLAELNAQITANTNQVKANELAMKSMRENIGLSGMTINQLRTHLHLLKSALSQLSADDATMKKLRDEIERTERQIKKMTTGASDLSLWWERQAQMLNKYAAAYALVGMAIYAVTSKLNMFTDQMKELEDKMSGAQRTTDLTANEIWRLKQNFDKLDTRTATNDLIDLTKVAGRMNVAKKDIDGFVRSMDKIQVALGEDLGTDAEATAEALGKVVNSFELDKKWGLEESLLRVGNLLNGLDKASTASAKNILEYITRLSGVANISNIGIEVVAGYAATLDMANMKVESGATAIQRLFLGLGKNAKDYAKILGMTNEEYAKMVKNSPKDALDALLQVVGNNSDSLIELSRILDVVDVNEQRSIAVLGSLAKRRGEVNRQIGIGTELIQNSDGVLKEFNLTNNNFAGQMEKQSKRIKALSTDIGKDLEPTALAARKTYADFLTLLRDSIYWIKENSVVIGLLAAAFGAMKLVMLSANGTLSVFVDNLKTFAKEAIKSLKSIWAAMSTNPIGILILALGALYTAYLAVNWAMKKTNVELEENAMAAKKAKEAIGNEAAELELLRKIATDATVSREAQNNAIKKMNDILPDSVLLLNRENIASKETTEAIRRYTEAKMNSAKADAYLNRYKELYTKRITTDEDYAMKMQTETPSAQDYMLASLDLGLAGSPTDFMKRRLKDEHDQSVKDTEARMKFTLGEYTKSYALTQPSGIFANKNTKAVPYQTDYPEVNNPYDLMKYATSDYIYNVDAQPEPEKANDEKKLINPITGEIETDKERKERIRKEKDELKSQRAEIDAWYKTEQANQKIRDDAEGTNKLKQAENLLAIDVDYYKKLEELYKNDAKKYAEFYKKRTEAELKLKKNDGAQLIKDLEREKQQTIYDLQGEYLGENKGYSVTIDGKTETGLVNTNMLKTKEELAMAMLQVDVDYAAKELAIYETLKNADLSFTDQYEAAKLKLQNAKMSLKDAKEKEQTKEDKLKYASDLKESNDELSEFNKQLKQTENQYGKTFIGLIKQLNLTTDKINEMKKAGKENSKEMEKVVDIQKNLAKELETTLINGANTSLNILYDYMSSAEMTDAEFKRRMILTALDTLEQLIQIYVVSALGKEIGEKGWYGIITGAAAGVVIKTAFAALKSAVNSNIGIQSNRELNHSKSVKQYADGRYPVVGENDGRTYNAAYTNNLTTGVYDKPTIGLFSEKMPEMVVDGMTTKKLMMNYPRIMEGIYTLSRGRMPQFENGRYPATQTTAQTDNTEIMLGMIATMNRMNDTINQLQQNGVKGVWQWQTYKDGIDKMDRLSKRVTR